MTMFSAQEAINRLCDKREIFYDEMVDLMRQVMEGKVSHVQLAAKAGLPVAEPLWFEPDESVVGMPFLISRRAPGRNFGSSRA